MVRIKRIIFYLTINDIIYYNIIIMVNNMKINKVIIWLLFLFMFFFIGCDKPVEEDKDKEDNSDIEEIDPKDEPHEHIASDWIYPEGSECGDEVDAKIVCTICGEVLETEHTFRDHDLVKEIIPPTCEENGKEIEYCKNCTYRFEKKIYKTGHEKSGYIIIKEATDTLPGIKQVKCLKCDKVLEEFKYVKNGYLDHGALQVIGQDLCDKDGNKFQLYGLSYHGLQWFGRYVNHDTICALQQNFGINVIRLACYTTESGYVDGGALVKSNYKDYIDKAIKCAEEIGLYVVIDWHMVGAVDVKDKNPLSYIDDAIEFFTYVSNKYKDYNNVIYEIMNEPCGETTWDDCKEYANVIIPIIRENTNALILVGNPHWSSDLVSVKESPLTGYNNIMYTYHFYANDIKTPNAVINAYRDGLPIFISEFGFMDASGDGDMNYETGINWLNTLDELNISYIAWNISNSKGSASILKQGNGTMTEFIDENLKEWGIYLRNYYRTKSGIDN